jgi:hypothetical protein
MPTVHRRLSDDEVIMTTRSTRTALLTAVVIALTLWAAPTTHARIRPGAEFAAAVPAQTEPGVPALIVRLTDVTSEPLIGIAIVVRDRSAQQIVGQAVTNDSGEAVLDRIPLDTVRVAAEGTLPRGVSLMHKGLDVGGILITLDVVSTRVDLVVEQDGLVRLDPMASIALEAGAPSDAAIPTAIIAEGLPSPPPVPAAAVPDAPIIPQTTATVSVIASVPPATEAETEADPGLSWGLAFLVLLTVVVVAVSFLTVERRRT